LTWWSTASVIEALRRRAVRDSIELERRGIPTVTIISRNFFNVGRQIAARAGSATLPIAEIAATAPGA